MLKWVEIAETSQKARYDFLSSYLKASGVENSWEHLPATSDDVISVIEKAMTSVDQILIEEKFGNLMREKLVDLSTKHYFSPTSDSIFKQNGKWFPKSFLEESFIETLNKNVDAFDIQAGALIVGCGTLARIAINGFLKVGYKKISVCDKDQKSVEEFFSDFTKRNFNLDLKFVSQDELAYLPGTSSLLVNTVSSGPENDLMNDLFYFNYLNKSAVVVDLNLYPVESPLLQQAKDLGIQLVDGYKFYALQDFYWMQAISNKKLNWEGYLDSWLSAVKSNPM
ncbi:MAG: hypothetical protein KDD37_07160 [Bdellovibrionales bacterium]|nr:hypothetical protein [Bdellovibrionales bacterium]